MSNSLDIKPLPFDTDFLALHELNPQRYPFLLESVARGPQARFDILFAFPQQELTLNSLHHVDDNASSSKAETFLSALDAWFAREKTASRVDDLPFCGGWFLYLAYELAAEIEPTLTLSTASTWLPRAKAVRVPAAIVRDWQQKKCYWVAEPEFTDLYKEFTRDLTLIRTDAAPVDADVKVTIDEENPARYIESIRRIVRYIRDGDVFQVNISRLWQGVFQKNVSPPQLYRRLKQHNPAPFAGIARIGDVSVLSSSPERLLQRHGDRIDTRPIAGTRPRARDATGKIDRIADEQLRRELIQHPKERAEHVMLIDLERNDIGRIAKPGSVKVNELMVVESYEHVHHIVSNVSGQLREGVTPGQTIAALFPGGTITGCPKVRCMQIIAELEQAPREAYTGAMGYLNRNGDMDLNILIRTMMVRGNELKFRAGGGIVADSIAEREVEETRAKAKGLLRALGQ